MIRCLLVDDHPIVRTGYRRLLEQRGTVAVVAEAGDAASAYTEFLRHAPDVTVTDLTLPGASGMELLRRIRARSREAKVLVFTMHETPLLASRALAAGADGFVTKSSPPETLIEAVDAVAAGRSYFGDEVRGDDHPLSEPRRLDALTPRELEILRLLARGRSTAECAHALHLSPKTVANYQSLIRDKVGVDTNSALVHLALRNGLIQGGS